MIPHILHERETKKLSPEFSYLCSVPVFKANNQTLRGATNIKKLWSTFLDTSGSAHTLGGLSALLKHQPK